MELDLHRLRDVDHDQDSGGTAPAGKSSLTSRLTPAPQIVFRVSDPETARALGEALSSGRGRVQRVAERDDNGVAAGAEAAVDRAAGSTGQALPTHLQRQFEQSTGADLSSVRVHTGADSAAAAHAVGAKAYTVGQDIHFADGRYQPDDPFGMHLLAHEVAHTVQQQGGAATRQHKLEVSTPHDVAEVEADRAADAMVRGAPAEIAGAAGLARKQVQRDPNVITLPEQRIDSQEPNVITLPEQRIDSQEPNVITLPEQRIDSQEPNVITLPEVEIKSDVITLPELEIEGTDTRPADASKMASNADAAQKKAEENAKSGGGSNIGDVSAVIVEDKAAADKVQSLITAAGPNLESGIATGGVPSSVRGTNQQALGALSLYSETKETDKFNNDSFLQQSQVLAADFGRLRAQMATLDKSGQSGGRIADATDKMAPGEARGRRAGETAIDVAGGGSAAELNKSFKETMTGKDGDARQSSNATTHWKNAQDREKEMKEASQRVAEGGRDMMPKQSAAQAATARIKAMAAGGEVAAYTGEIEKLKADAAAAEEKVKLAGGTIKNAASIAFAATDAKGPNVGAIVGAALDMVTNIVAYTAKHWNDSDIEDKEEKKKVAKANEIFQNANAAAKEAAKAVGELKNVATKYYESLTTLSEAKTKYRDAMKLMGESLDKAQGGNAFSITAQVLSEAEAYLTQSKLTIESGKNALGRLPADQGGSRMVSNASGQVTYFLANGVEQKDGSTKYFPLRGSFTMKGALPNGGVLAEALTPVVTKMEQERSEIEGLAKSLRAVFKA